MDRFAQAHNVSAKALIPICGEPMLGRVARALLDSPSVAEVIVLAQAPAALMRGPLHWMAEHERIRGVGANSGISLSIDAIAASPEARYPMLVVTADHVLLTSDIVEAFIAGSRGCDAAFAAVERKVAETAHPGTRRTWIALSDGAYTGANLFALGTAKARRALDAWAGIEQKRKNKLRMLLAIGPAILFRALTRTISLQAAAERSGRKIGINLRAVILPFDDAAIDVDKPEDLKLAERILGARQRQ